ncbi:MAG: hypothetical protein JSS02_09790 [Planctomycetes bacterium]|nr:hypothetical protein [Planctomycetota bacterium]
MNYARSSSRMQRQPRPRHACGAITAFLVLTVALLEGGFPSSRLVLAQPSSVPSRKPAGAQARPKGKVASSELAAAVPWGEAASGLRMRAVAVAAETDEQQPDFQKALSARRSGDSEYATPDKVTLLVEIQNVSDRPMALQGTRYGDAVSPPSEGKSFSDVFAPTLFRAEVRDQAGKLIESPVRTRMATDSMMTLSSGRVEKLEPQKSVVMLVRPLHWDAALASQLAEGKFQLVLSYLGHSAEVTKEFARVWPDKELARAWAGTIQAAPVGFTISRPKLKRPRPELVWGNVVNGLEAAVEVCHRKPGRLTAEDDATMTFPHGSQLAVRLHVRNAGETPVSFWSETWRQDDRIFLIGDAGQAIPLPHAWYSGWPIKERWTLKPGQTTVLQAISLAVVQEKGDAEQLEQPVGPTIVGAAGDYKIRVDLTFNSWKTKTPDGQPIPGPEDWQGNVTTGDLTIHVRDRVPEDDPPTMTARLKFQSPTGNPVVKGEVLVKRQSYQTLASGDLESNVFEVPRCPFEPISIEIRAAGYEETVFRDVAVQPDTATVLTLTPAKPLQFRLVSRDKQPVADAEVRYFLRSKKAASAGPYPMQGLKGPTWGWSDKQGRVVLDTLQKFDPLDQKLGNNIYWFYVEPAGLAPLMIGPVEAGENLGDIEVGPFLEVAGEVHGTAEELAAFSAEWDQPMPMKRGDGSIGWHYGTSQKLETQKNGDVLTFKLTGLAPGKFRIVSRFQSGGQPIKHSYTFREPTEDDVVFEVDLTDSRDDLIVKNQKSKP